MAAAIPTRAKSSGIVLTEDDARVVKGMILRGDRQHDIAAWFGVNGGRIAEVATGATFWWVSAAALEILPLPGPYVVRELMAALDDALPELGGGPPSN